MKRKKQEEQIEDVNVEVLKFVECIALAVRDMAAGLDYANILDKSVASGYAERVNGIVTHMNAVLNKLGYQYPIPDNRQRDKEPYMVRGLPF